MTAFQQGHPGQQRREVGEGHPRQLAAALDAFAPIGALMATAALIAIAAITAMSASGCALAETCTADDDCNTSGVCIDGSCMERVRRTIDIEGTDDAAPIRVEGFAHVERLVITAGTVSDDLAGFPTLITVVDRNLRHVAEDGFVRSLDGDDIAFFAVEGTETVALPREIELYDGEAGVLTAWVRIPIIRADVDTAIALAFGQDLDAPDHEAPLPVARVWRDNYVAVWHLDAVIDDVDEVDGTDGGSHVIDALGLAFGRAWSLSNNDVVPGMVGGGLRFTDPSACIEVPAPSVMPSPVDVVDSITIEAWARADSSATTTSRPLYRRGDVNAPAVLDMALTDARATFTVEGAPASTPVDDVGAYHHYAGVFGGGQQRLFVDGAVRWNAAAPVETLGTGAPTHIGNVASPEALPAASSFGGILDEVRIAARPLSSAWIRAVADNARDPASFVVRAR